LWAFADGELIRMKGIMPYVKLISQNIFGETEKMTKIICLVSRPEEIRN
jgi:hypothetical protein